VDEESGTVGLNDRALAVVKEVIENNPETVTMAMVPMADFAKEVNRLIERKNIVDSHTATSRHGERAEQEEKKDTDYPFKETIDKALRLIYAQEHRYYVKLMGEHPALTSVEELRNGPVGRDLRLLARIAHGEIEYALDDVLRAVESVLELLFWSPGSD